MSYQDMSRITASSTGKYMARSALKTGQFAVGYQPLTGDAQAKCGLARLAIPDMQASVY
jgi:hypothetical protein